MQLITNTMDLTLDEEVLFAILSTVKTRTLGFGFMGDAYLPGIRLTQKIDTPKYSQYLVLGPVVSVKKDAHGDVIGAQYSDAVYPKLYLVQEYHNSTIIHVPMTNNLEVSTQTKDLYLEKLVYPEFLSDVNPEEWSRTKLYEKTQDDLALYVIKKILKSHFAQKISILQSEKEN